MQIFSYRPCPPEPSQ